MSNQGVGRLIGEEGAWNKHLQEIKMSKKEILVCFIIVCLVNAVFGSIYAAVINHSVFANGQSIIERAINIQPDNGVTITLPVNIRELNENNSLVTITIVNTHTADAVSLSINIFYTGEDDSDSLAAGLLVTALTYGGVDLLPAVFDINLNGVIDLQDLAASNLGSQPGLSAGDSKDIVISTVLSDHGGEFDVEELDLVINLVLF